MDQLLLMLCISAMCVIVTSFHLEVEDLSTEGKLRVQCRVNWSNDTEQLSDLREVAELKLHQDGETQVVSSSWLVNTVSGGGGHGVKDRAFTGKENVCSKESHATGGVPHEQDGGLLCVVYTTTVRVNESVLLHCDLADSNRSIANTLISVEVRTFAIALPPSETSFLLPGSDTLFFQITFSL